MDLFKIDFAPTFPGDDYFDARGIEAAPLFDRLHGVGTDVVELKGIFPFGVGSRGGYYRVPLLEMYDYSLQGLILPVLDCTANMEVLTGEVLLFYRGRNKCVLADWEAEPCRRSQPRSAPGWSPGYTRRRP